MTVQIILPENIEISKTTSKASAYWTKGDTELVTVSKHRKYGNTNVRARWLINPVDKSEAKLVSLSATPASMMLDDDPEELDSLETEEFCKRIENLELIPSSHIDAIERWAARVEINWKF